MLKLTLALLYFSNIVLGRYLPLDEFERVHSDWYYNLIRVHHIDSFDDVASRGLINFADLGQYGEADYTGLAVAEASELSKTLGIIPRSMPNAVYYGGINGLLSPGKEAQIRVQCLPGQCYGEVYFKPRSFWFGCLTLSAKPGSCTVTVTSYQGSEPAETQEFRFEASLIALSSNMTQAVFREDFTWVTSLVFTTVVEPLNPLGGTLLDDFEYVRTDIYMVN